MELVKAPSSRSGVVVHDPSTCVDELLAGFALTISGRGFQVAGLVQLNNRRATEQGQGYAERIELLDLGSGETIGVAREPYGALDGHVAAAAARVYRCAG